MDAPDKRMTFEATNRPWVWKIGKAWISLSELSKRQYPQSVRALDRRLSWVSIAPLERPVVPEV
ncbi:hypothetical protein D3C87_1852410 [compost metagenome]